jgi:hypothetical protein
LWFSFATLFGVLSCSYVSLGCLRWNPFPLIILSIFNINLKYNLVLLCFVFMFSCFITIKMCFSLSFAHLMFLSLVVLSWFLYSMLGFKLRVYLFILHLHNSCVSYTLLFHFAFFYLPSLLFNTLVLLN